MQVLRTVHGPALRRGALTLVLLAGVSTAAMAQTVPPPSPSPAASPALSPTALRAASVAAADSADGPSLHALSIRHPVSVNVHAGLRSVGDADVASGLGRARVPAGAG